VEEGVWRINLVSVWKDKGDLELSVDQANIDFFDLGTKLYHINQSISSPGKNMDDRLGLPAKSSLVKLCRYNIASIQLMCTKKASARSRSPSRQAGKGLNNGSNPLN